MKVLRGRLNSADRALLTESNRERHPVLVATLHGCIRGRGCEEPMQAVGICTGWDHEAFRLGSIADTFQTTVPWLEAVRVWHRDDAPTKEEVDALLSERMEEREAERDAAFSVWAVLKFLLKEPPVHERDGDDEVLVAAERFKRHAWDALGLSIEALEAHGRKNIARLIQPSSEAEGQPAEGKAL